MKKMMFLAAACLAFVMPKAAQADDWNDTPSLGDGFYVGGFGGVSFPDNVKQHRHRVKLDTGYLVGASLGYRTCGNFRFEGEIAYRHNDGKKSHSRHHHHHHHNKRGEFEATSVLANALYDFDMCWCVKPYVGFGLGWAHAKVTRGNSHHHHRHDHRHSSKDSFAWQAIAGVAYPLTCNIDLDLQYRYFQATDIKHYNDNDIVLGLRYNF